MPTPKKGPRLGGSPAHQRLILRNLATALFEHGRVTTTESRARTLRPYAEKLITKAKKGDLHNRRMVMRELFTSVDWKKLEEEDLFVVNKYPQHRLFTEIAPAMADRPGGYTRITKIGPRKGDNAPMAVIELVTEPYSPKASTKKTEKAETPKPAEKSAEAEETETTEVEAAEVESTDAEGTETEIKGFAAVPEADQDVTDGNVEGKYPGSHAPMENPDEAPEGFPIKGNEDSMKFHEPDGQWFDQTVAEVWFDTAESAEAAGFTRAGD